jgi:hypothetical protein
MSGPATMAPGGKCRLRFGGVISLAATLIMESSQCPDAGRGTTSSFRGSRQVVGNGVRFLWVNSTRPSRVAGYLLLRTGWPRLGRNDLDCRATWVRTVSGPDGTDHQGVAATSGRGARRRRTGAGWAARSAGAGGRRGTPRFTSQAQNRSSGETYKDLGLLYGLRNTSEARLEIEMLAGGPARRVGGRRRLASRDHRGAEAVTVGAEADGRPVVGAGGDDALQRTAVTAGTRGREFGSGNPAGRADLLAPGLGAQVGGLAQDRGELAGEAVGCHGGFSSNDCVGFACRMATSSVASATVCPILKGSSIWA